MKYDVISFGSAILDVSLKSSEIKIVDSKDFFSKKALMLPYGLKAGVEELTISSGGGGTNTAIGLSHLDLKVAIVARCGWDFAGRIIRQELKKEKVSDEFLVQIEGEKTDYSTILIGPDGNRTILVYRGGTSLEKSVIDFKSLNSFYFCISSLEGNLSLLKELVTFAKERHIKVALNPGQREIKQREELLQIAQEVDFFIVNEKEAMLLTQEKAEKKLIALLPKVKVIVTKGTKGVVLYQKDKKEIKKKALKVKMVDQTGAGDAFVSGFVGGLALGFSLDKSLNLGIANGASVVTKIGAKEGLIKTKELDFWLKKEGK